jgi:cell division septal protein FtsQ
MLRLPKKKDKGPLRKKKQKWQPTHLQLQLIVGAVITVVIALLVTAIWYGTRVPSLQIAAIEVIGGETIPHFVIEEKVNAELVGAYLQLVPNRFMPMYPRSKIEKSILSLDRVKNVHVELTGNQTLTVVFDEHVPYALWCEKTDSELCLFIDKSGFAFASAPELQGSAFVRYIDEGAIPQKDAQGFESSFVKETEEFVTLLQDQLSLYTTHVQKKGVYDVEYTISGGGVIKVSQSIPMQESFENLQTILTSEEFKHIEPGAFQYIDLRFGDKVFVNEAPISSADVSTTTASTSIPL